MVISIYFCGSIRAGRNDVELYGRLISRLKESGPVLTEFVGDPSITEKGSEQITEKEIHDRDLELLEKADGARLPTYVCSYS